MAEASWDDLQLFHVVAEAGGLSGAAQRTGISAPTIGRRMLALERTLGRSLFVRSQRGYQLAYDGEVLYERVSRMQGIAEDISAWHRDAFALPFVSIAIDGWLSPFIADHIESIRGADDAFSMCCSSAGPSLDMKFRGADVAVLSARPDNGNLAVRRAVNVAYAVYRPVGPDRIDLPWISMSTGSAISPVDRWVFENHEASIMTWTEDRQLVRTLVACGAGRGILPVYAGDADPRLQREGGVIEDLTHPLFIIANDDDRHRPEVRLVIERLAAFLKAEAARLAGQASS
ncbi:LysR family transcriptional regulator [Martelella soudanensis]|uniref:LysR family transcriptional regulator n=1 Tax=unclassified Martelella TaxID=2629616 RepID=UPI0015DDE622|nr:MULTISPECIES: LysR family transcriptional regulator [unclassified Martelella]